VTAYSVVRPINFSNRGASRERRTSRDNYVLPLAVRFRRQYYT